MKRKTVERVLALACAFALAVPLGGCGGTGRNSGAPLVGFNTWGAGDATFDVMGDEIAYALTVLGAEYSRASDDYTADKELQNIQNFISAQVDGIVMQISSDPVLPQAAGECAKAGIPFVLGIFTGTDGDRAELAENNPYYAGSVSADMVLDGYRMGQAAIEAGYTTAVLIGGNVGHLHMDMRTAGFAQAFVTEGGGVILDAARCSSPAECQEKANALLSAYPGAGCMYAMAGDYVSGSMNAMDTLGLEIPLYVSNANRDTADYIRSGRVAAASGGNDLAAPIAAALLINYLNGHPIVDGDGHPPTLTTRLFSIDRSSVDAWEEVFFGGDSHPLTEERLQSLLWSEDNNVDYDTFMRFINEVMNLETILADHGK